MVRWHGFLLQPRHELVLSDLSQRVALARAFKAAVYLYARRVMSMIGFPHHESESCKDRDMIENELGTFKPQENSTPKTQEEWQDFRLRIVGTTELVKSHFHKLVEVPSSPASFTKLLQATVMAE